MEILVTAYVDARHPVKGYFHIKGDAFDGANILRKIRNFDNAFNAAQHGASDLALFEPQLLHISSRPR